MARSQYSDVAPARHLYPDLVEYLFLLMADLEADNQTWRRTILYLSQVCRKWRNTALSAKQLWARLIDFEKGTNQWNQELLRRSHPLPIDLMSRSFLPRSVETISTELQYLDRIRSYRICFDETAFPTLLDMFQQPAFNLQRLTLTNRPANASPPFILPSSAFAGQAPKLRRLELVHCVIDFHSPITQNVTRLTVLDLEPKTAPSSLEWLEYLHLMPNLLKVTLQNAIAPADDFDFELSSHTPSTLSLLTHLELEGRLFDLGILLQHLIIPPTCELNIVATRSSDGPELGVIVGVFKRALQFAYSAKPDTCPLLLYGRGTSLSFSNEPLSSEIDEKSDEYATVYLDLETVPSDSWETLLPRTLVHLGNVLSTATSLELHLPSLTSDLLLYLNAATNVKTLANLTSIMSQKALQALQVIQPDGSIPLPALDTIFFTDDESMWGRAYASFKAFLRWRIANEHPIKVISFRRCAVIAERRWALEQLGIHVDCDSTGVNWRNL